MNSRLLLSLILILTLLISSCKTEKTNKLILNESFNDNKMGWPEENTSSHYLDIADGFYQIASKDANAGRTSSGSLLSNYLVNLPSAYSIESSMKLIESENNETHYGILLLSASLEYSISVYSSGWVLFTEYDRNIDSIYTMSSKYIELEPNDFTKIEMDIKQNKFSLRVNDTEIGTGEFKTKTENWFDLRLYTSKASSIKVDDLKIKNATHN